MKIFPPTMLIFTTNDMRFLTLHITFSTGNGTNKIGDRQIIDHKNQTQPVCTLKFLVSIILFIFLDAK